MNKLSEIAMLSLLTVAGYNNCNAEIVDQNDSEVLRAVKMAAYATAAPEKICDPQSLSSTLSTDMTSIVCKLNYSPTTSELENIEACANNNHQVADKTDMLYKSMLLQYSHMSEDDRQKTCKDNTPAALEWMQKRKPDEPQVITGKRDIRGISTGMDLNEATQTLQKSFKECASNNGNLTCSDKAGYNGRITVFVTKTNPHKVWYIEYTFSAPETSKARERLTIRAYNLIFVKQVNIRETKYKLPSGEIFEWSGGDAPGSNLKIEIMDQELHSIDEKKAEQIRRQSIPEPKF